MSCAEPLSLSSPGPKIFNSKWIQSQRRFSQRKFSQRKISQRRLSQPATLNGSASTFPIPPKKAISTFETQIVRGMCQINLPSRQVPINPNLAPRGKFFSWSDKDKDLSSGDVNKIVIPVAEARRISACGKSDSTSGTQGSFDLYDGETKIAHFSWSCPWGSPSNSLEASDHSKNYWVQLGAWNPIGGAIGSVEVEVQRKNT